MPSSHYLYYFIILIPCRTRGNTHRQPHNAISVNDVQHVKSFITNYAEENAISLPGRIPGYKDYRFQLLPSSNSKRSIHNFYQTATAKTVLWPVAYSTFCALWNKYVPYIIVAKPRTDLCWQCMKNNSSIVRSRNFSEEFRSQVKCTQFNNIPLHMIDIHVYERAIKHIERAKTERDYYRSVCKSSSDSLKALYPGMSIPPP